MPKHITFAEVQKRKRLQKPSMAFIDEDERDDLRLTLSPPGLHYQAFQGLSAMAFVGGYLDNGKHISNGGPSNSKTTPNGSTSNSTNTNSNGNHEEVQTATSSRRGRRKMCNSNGDANKEELITPPYPWATDRRATVHSLEYLLGHGICTIQGNVSCRRCDNKEIREVDLQSAFLPLSNFFLTSKDSMHDRAPKVWMNPHVFDCGACHQNDCMRPVIHEKKRKINWLYLLLTQTLGLCTLDQLKYFCKHTKKHRTGAKDRVLYLTYVGLLKQLNPAGPYE